jgi:hypothetical protein
MDDTEQVVAAADTIAARLDAATHTQLMEWAGRSSIGDPDPGAVVRARLDDDTE